MKSIPFNIGVFISSLSIGDEIKKIAKEQKDTFQIFYKSLEGAIPVGKRMEQEGVEAIISRRGTAHLLRENLRIPVFSFPQSSLSILTSIKKAADRLAEAPEKNMKIFMPNFRNEISGLEIVEELLDVQFAQGVYFDSTSLGELILDASHQGFGAIVGGLATMGFAMKCGLMFQELITPKENIIETIENAKSAALSNREQKATTLRYQSIMDLASDGIISIDSKGLLTTINKKAKVVLNVGNEDVLGTPASGLITNVNLQRALQRQTSVQDKVEEIGSELFVYNQEPIIVKDHTVGVVSSFKEVANVMRAENKVRRTLTKGFVAKYILEDLIYCSAAMDKIVNTSKELAKTDSTILVMGKTGTGKEVIAQSVHNLSQRNKMPFVSVHCGALPEQLLESELFGYEEGAFTGSKKGGKLGLFEMAHQGTIFLDEIDSTSHSVQLRLLRVLQEKEVMRIGADRKIPVNVRVIAAAGKDLWSVVQDGKFRKDLFFRLNVLRITLPSLGERKEDISLLLKHFIQYHARIHGITPIELPQPYIDKLTDYSWPGNVRQLKHFAEQLLLNSNFQGCTASLDSLFADLSNIVDKEEVSSQKEIPEQVKENLKLSDPESEVETIHKALHKAQFSKAKAAKILGISRTTLWRKLKELS
ncbi:sigma 54-interacting transcriptional regulator [Desulfocastanea catecholica]